MEPETWAYFPDIFNVTRPIPLNVHPLPPDILPPVNDSVVVNGDEVTVFWTVTDPNTQQIEIYRDCQLIATVPPTPSYYTDVGVLPGIHFYYEVAVVDGWESALSNQSKAPVGFEVLLEEDFTNPDPGWQLSGDWEIGTGWDVTPHSPPDLAATIIGGCYNISTCSYLTSPAVTLGPYGGALVFKHWYEIEEGWDGGNVKISTDGGNTWQLITPDGGYPYTISTYNPCIPGEEGYSGNSMGWEPAVFNLSAYANQTIMIRWEFGSDESFTYQGWYIDDVEILNATQGFVDPSADNVVTTPEFVQPYTPPCVGPTIIDVTVTNNGNDVIDSMLVQVVAFDGTDTVYVDSMWEYNVAALETRVVSFSWQVPDDCHATYTITASVPFSDPVDVNAGNNAVSIVKKLGEVYYDDRTPYTARAWYSAGNGWGIKYHPDQPESLMIDTVDMYFWGGDWPTPGGDEAGVFIFDDDGPNGLPGTQLYGDTVTITRGAFNYIPIDPPVIDRNGTFYVFYIQVADYPNCPGLGYDAFDNAPDSSQWTLVGGTFSVDTDTGDIMISVHKCVIGCPVEIHDVGAVSIDFPSYTVCPDSTYTPLATVYNMGM